MKNFLNFLLVLNTVYVLACSENQNITVFLLPACVYLVVGFLRIYHKEFSNFIKYGHEHQN
ncbi:hypothetical protein AB670_00062 [Chryseobacterium sp. MOF25P]|uniref:hypothetical protein n=1 Tax=Chryseobacterium TaxID=59732 RepID=UPI0008054C5B|nr:MULTISPECIES: hypothetical protein [Chryseobacterium]OBW43532.1 hypothetical protein AB670_00062 [Chryseobacterium sp. MOF25P]OBW46694.1 hypothetical protein AB671_01189 [Chryseobacterium sp. BGARF1]